jgi:thiosulfate/3-mercaptopyruvate sulfurtransferase
MTSLGPLIPAADALRLDGAARIDARPSPTRFAAGHLTLAVHADLERDLSTPRAGFEGGRHPLPTPEEWSRTLGEWGITPTTPVVIYDESGGGLAAARAWWMLRAVGHEDVAVVDGGLQALVQAGASLVGDPELAPPTSRYPVTAWSSPMVDADAVSAACVDGATLILDARSQRRFLGLEEPLDPVPGRIPGTTNVPWTSHVRDGVLRPRDELDALYRPLLDSAAEVIATCDTGVTACHTLLVLEHLGVVGASLYVGSYSEWCRTRPDRVESG